MSVETSRDAFLRALERLLSVPDAPSPGINAVAREAGLNKVLLYRYFGSWDEFLVAFAPRVNPWRDLWTEVEAGLAVYRWPDLRSLLKWLFRSYLANLVASPLVQNLLRLSFVDRDPLQAALEKDREVAGRALFQAISQRFPLSGLADPEAQAALITGGLSWLVIAGSRAGTFSGLSFGDPGEVVDRLGGVIDAWVDALTPFGGFPIL